MTKDECAKKVGLDPNDPLFWSKVWKIIQDIISLFAQQTSQGTPQQAAACDLEMLAEHKKVICSAAHTLNQAICCMESCCDQDGE